LTTLDKAKLASSITFILLASFTIITYDRQNMFIIQATGVIILGVATLSVVMLGVATLSVVILRFAMIISFCQTNGLRFVMLSVIMLNVVTPNLIILNALMLSDVMTRAIMLSLEAGNHY
jgi:hypothetical protein